MLLDWRDLGPCVADADPDDRATSPGFRPCRYPLASPKTEFHSIRPRTPGGSFGLVRRDRLQNLKDEPNVDCCHRQVANLGICVPLERRRPLGGVFGTFPPRLMSGYVPGRALLEGQRLGLLDGLGSLAAPRSSMVSMASTTSKCAAVAFLRASARLTRSTSPRPILRARPAIINHLRDESGVTAIEYCLIATGIAIAIITTVQGIGPQLNTKFASLSSSLK